MSLSAQGFNRIASCPVQVNFTLTVPPVTLSLPLASDPNLTTTVSPPIAHWGPGPVHMRLISHELREGQVRLRRSNTVMRTRHSSRWSNDIWPLIHCEEVQTFVHELPVSFCPPCDEICLYVIWFWQRDLPLYLVLKSLKNFQICNQSVNQLRERFNT